MSNNSQKENSNNKTSRIIRSILIAVFVIVVVSFIQNFSSIDFIELFRPGKEIERVRKKMKQKLKEKYGEEFVVDRIGTRSSRGEEYYRARIYPKSILGTKKEGDSYFYASGTVDKLPWGRLGEVGDSYALVNLKLDIEDHLHPKIQSIFGRKVLTKAEAHYKKREPGNETFWGYKVNSYEEAKDSIAKDPKNRMIELTLYLYIFDRIDSPKEKEKRRKDIFEFVQYLKEEGLFRYLEMGVIFIDERVLAPSYEKYEDKMYDTDWVTKEVEGETIELPPDSFRTAMSKGLQSEIDTMNEKNLVENMKEIRKSELKYEGISKYNTQYIVWVYSKGMLKSNYQSSYEEAKSKNNLEHYSYMDISNIGLLSDLEYIYLNKRGKK